MTLSRTDQEALQMMRDALLTGAAQMDETSAALTQAVHLLEGTALLAAQSTQLRDMVQTDLIAFTTRAQTRYQALASALDQVIETGDARIDGSP